MTGLDFGVIQRALPFLLEGLALSFFLTAVAMLGGIVLGLGLAVVRLSRWKALSILAAGYVERLPGHPARARDLLVLLSGAAGARPIRKRAAIGRHRLRVIRGRLLFGDISGRSPKHQAWPVAGSLCLRTRLFPALRLVILPQALRNMLPLMITQAVVLFQDTSLVYVISLRDFMNLRASSPTAITG